MSKELKNKKLLEERKDKALKVSELIEFLKQMPQNAIVGRVGHFGELFECDKYAVTERLCYITPKVWEWNSAYRQNIEIVNINMPDIGEDPG